MYKYNPFIMQNIRANTLIIGANNNPINKKVRFISVPLKLGRIKN